MPLDSEGQSAWSIVNSPNTSTTQHNFLNDVTCVSASDCWAVGWYYGTTPFQTLIERWDGTSWAVVTSPNTSTTQDNFLIDVTCVSASDCWAVGYYIGSTEQTLIERWDGTSWAIVISPNIAAQYNFLKGVACVSASDCWAVGYYLDGIAYHTLIERWDGTLWTIVVASPNTSPTQNNFLTAVTCVSAFDCWAVGYHGTSDWQPLIERWDGTSWAIVSSPNIPNAQFNTLRGVTCVSATECWTVGYSSINGSKNQTLIEQWDGTSWAIVSSPNTLPTETNSLASVTCVSASDCWAVGYYRAGSTALQTLIERWDGTSWAIVTSPNTSVTQDNILTGVTCVSASDCWAVGRHVGGSAVRTLTEHYTASLPPNLPPTARLTANPASGAAPLPVAFDASTSSDPDSADTIASYTFDFGDGSATVTQAGATTSHTYTSAGTYTATVTVEDNHGLQSANTASVPIQVSPPDPDPFALSISGVSHSGPVVTITGALDVGTEAMKPVAVMADPEDDDFDGGALTDDGLDLAGGSIGLDAAGNLVFTLTTYDMSPVLDAVAPTFVYDWYVSVDGVEMGYLLQAGYVGGFGEVNTGKFFKLCRRSNGFSCPTSLTGTMGGNTVTVTVPPGLIGARRGSLIDVGTGNGAACPGICSTSQPVGAHQHNTGGDSAAPAGYMVPGGVKVGVAPATTPDEEVQYTTWASVGADGTWSAAVTVVGITAGVSYKAVAQTCSGLADAPACATAVRVFTA